MPQMKASFFAAGPDMFPGKTVAPFENVNLYPWMAHMLGLTPAKNDGSLNILAGTPARQWREDSGGRRDQKSGAKPSMSAVVLGIDGGGTRTRASIVNESRMLAFAETGSIKRLRVGAVVAEQNLRALLAEVYKQAGVRPCAAAPAWPAPACLASGVDHSRVCRLLA